ncbi:trypco2 family protein [Streptomyces sp. NPDC052301]|uniref:trypco2 family protein n=1 Tax=Streptomyces sp. NPDC052301 TaxID=3365687 RepID=UPI0037CF5076
MIELSAAVAAIREEIVASMSAANTSGIHFPVGRIQLEFQVGVTRTDNGRAGLKLWVLELGGDKGRSRQELQTVTVTLEAPVDDHGAPVKVFHTSESKP